LSRPWPQADSQRDSESIPASAGSEGVRIMADFTPEEEGAGRGEVVVFWSWAVLIGFGLVTMITIPLLGR
jgi:hypothetical protein